MNRPPVLGLTPRRVAAVLLGAGGAATLGAAVALFALQFPRGLAAGIGAALVPAAVGAAASVAARRLWRGAHASSRRTR